VTDPTRAAPPAPTAATAPLPTGPQLAGAIGAALAAPASRIAQALQDLHGRQTPGDPALASLEAAGEQVRQIARRSQQLARLAAGRLRQSHEKLALHSILHDVLLEHHAALAARGITLSQHLRPVDIIVDPGLLVSLLQAAIDWAAEQGTGLRVKLGMRNWPENGLLVLQATRAVQVAGDPGEAAEPDTLAWFLLQLTAQAMGVPVSREADAQGITATLEFPRTVRNLSGLTALDVEPAAAAAAGGHGQPADRNFGDTVGAGRHFQGASILLVTDDPRLQHEVGRVCQRLNLRLDASPTTRQATRFCELSTPHLIVIDEVLHDAEFDRLHADLVRHNTQVPVVEVAAADEGLAISSWDEGSTSRIGRQHIAQHLPAALALELSKLA